MDFDWSDGFDWDPDFPVDEEDRDNYKSNRPDPVDDWDDKAFEGGI